MREILSAVTPGAKAAVELPMNKLLFTDRPVYDSDLGIVGDRQRIPDSLQLLPESVKQMLFSETVTASGAPEFQTPALVRYAASQALPLSEGVGKSVQAVSDPDGAPNPFAPLSFLTGVRITERKRQQEIQDRRRALAERRRIAAKLRKQKHRPVSKTRLDAIKARLAAEQGQ